jgi:hypothetical protein
MTPILWPMLILTCGDTSPGDSDAPDTGDPTVSVDTATDSTPSETGQQETGALDSATDTGDADPTGWGDTPRFLEPDDADWSVFGAFERTNLGYNAAAGDVTGDGQADVILRDRLEDVLLLMPGPLSAGQAPHTDATLLIDTQEGRSIGHSLVVADVNGDGIGDLIAGDPTTSGGLVYLFLGPIDDPTTGPEFILRGRGSRDEVGDRANLVDGGRDLTGDGIPDLAAGTPFDSGYQANQGMIAIVPMPVSGDWSFDDAPARLLGEGANAGLGSGGSATVDMNGDGVADVITTSVGVGQIVVFWGPFSGDRGAASADLRLTSPDCAGETVAGDLDGDGHPDLIAGDHCYEPDPSRRSAYFGFFAPGSGSLDLHADADLVIVGTDIDDRLGASRSALAIGDLDQDGVADLVFTDTSAMGDRGRVYVLRGGATGHLDVNDMDLRIKGVDLNDRTGMAARLMDLDGDDALDLLVGTYTSDHLGIEDSGRVDVFFGASLQVDP